MAVALRCEGGRGRSYARGLRADARSLMTLLGLGDLELSIVIADDPLLRALNRKFRGKDSPTDVLSFPQFEAVHPVRGRESLAVRKHALTPDAVTALGDVVISFDTARRQARRLGVAAASRMRTLLVHGVLHLLGYDHERSPAEARRMFARERELRAALLKRAADEKKRGCRRTGGTRWTPRATV